MIIFFFVTLIQCPPVSTTKEMTDAGNIQVNHPTEDGACEDASSCNREISSPLAAKDGEQGTHAERREKNQGGYSARGEGTFYRCRPWSIFVVNYYFGAMSF